MSYTNTDHWLYFTMGTKDGSNKTAPTLLLVLQSQHLINKLTQPTHCETETSVPTMGITCNSELMEESSAEILLHAALNGY